MAEQYASMLRKAIARVVGAEARVEVYAKARAALLDQLKATGAPSAEVTHQRVVLEEAIQDVERQAVEAAFQSIDRNSARTPRERISATLKGSGPGDLRITLANTPTYVPPPWTPRKDI